MILITGILAVIGTLIVIAGYMIIIAISFVVSLIMIITGTFPTETNEPMIKSNTSNNIVIETELNKLSRKIKKALKKNKITIEVDDDAVRRQGINVEGFYSYFDRKIVLKSNEDSIKYALLHEIGHALDHIANISNEKAIKKSYMRREISFDNDYFYSTIKEYVAQSIADYCNGILPKDTIMYNKLDVILFSIAWDSIDED